MFLLILAWIIIIVIVIFVFFGVKMLFFTEWTDYLIVILAVAMILGGCWAIDYLNKYYKNKREIAAERG